MAGVLPAARQTWGGLDRPATLSVDEVWFDSLTLVLPKYADAQGVVPELYRIRLVCQESHSLQGHARRADLKRSSGRLRVTHLRPATWYTVEVRLSNTESPSETLRVRTAAPLTLAQGVVHPHRIHVLWSLPDAEIVSEDATLTAPLSTFARGGVLELDVHLKDTGVLTNPVQVVRAAVPPGCASGEIVVEGLGPNTPYFISARLGLGPQAAPLLGDHSGEDYQPLASTGDHHHHHHPAQPGQPDAGAARPAHLPAPGGVRFTPEGGEGEGEGEGGLLEPLESGCPQEEVGRILGGGGGGGVSAAVGLLEGRQSLGEEGETSTPPSSAHSSCSALPACLIPTIPETEGGGAGGGGGVEVAPGGESGCFGPWGPALRALTLPYVSFRVAEVGADFVKLAWHRPKPPHELHPCCGSAAVTSSSSSGVDDACASDGTSSCDSLCEGCEAAAIPLEQGTTGGGDGENGSTEAPQTAAGKTRRWKRLLPDLSRFGKRDSLIASTRVEVWEDPTWLIRRNALRRSKHRSPKQPEMFRAEVTASESRPYSFNEITIKGMASDKAYFMTVSHRNSVGDWSNPRRIRFATPREPEIVTLDIGQSSISVTATPAVAPRLPFCNLDVRFPAPTVFPNDTSGNSMDPPEGLKLDPSGRTYTGEGARRLPDGGRWQSVTGGAPPSRYALKCVDVDTGAATIKSATASEAIDPADGLLRLAVSGLRSGIAYLLSSRCLSGSTWSEWVPALLVTTVHPLRLRVVTRSESELTLRWGRTPVSTALPIPRQGSGGDSSVRLQSRLSSPSSNAYYYDEWADPGVFSGEPDADGRRAEEEEAEEAETRLRGVLQEEPDSAKVMGCDLTMVPFQEEVVQRSDAKERLAARRPDYRNILKISSFLQGVAGRYVSDSDSDEYTEVNQADEAKAAGLGDGLRRRLIREQPCLSTEHHIVRRGRSIPPPRQRCQNVGHIALALWREGGALPEEDDNDEIHELFPEQADEARCDAEENAYQKLLEAWGQGTLEGHGVADPFSIITSAERSKQTVVLRCDKESHVFTNLAENTLYSCRLAVRGESGVWHTCDTACGTTLMKGCSLGSLYPVTRQNCMVGAVPSSPSALVTCTAHLLRKHRREMSHRSDGRGSCPPGAEVEEEEISLYVDDVTESFARLSWHISEAVLRSLDDPQGRKKTAVEVRRQKRAAKGESHPEGDAWFREERLHYLSAARSTQSHGEDGRKSISCILAAPRCGGSQHRDHVEGVSGDGEEWLSDGSSSTVSTASESEPEGEGGVVLTHPVTSDMYQDAINWREVASLPEGVAGEQRRQRRRAKHAAKVTHRRRQTRRGKGHLHHHTHTPCGGEGGFPDALPPRGGCEGTSSAQSIHSASDSSNPTTPHGASAAPRPATKLRRRRGMEPATVPRRTLLPPEGAEGGRGGGPGGDSAAPGWRLEEVTADRFHNVPLREYKVELTALGDGGDAGAGSFEGSGGVRTIYFRAALSRVHLTGLRPDMRYRAVLSLYDPHADEWGFHSGAVELRALHAASLRISDIHKDLIAFSWDRQKAWPAAHGGASLTGMSGGRQPPSTTLDSSHYARRASEADPPLGVRCYKVVLTAKPPSLPCGGDSPPEDALPPPEVIEKQVVAQAGCTHRLYSLLPSTVYSATVRPLYEGGFWGSPSPPVDFFYAYVVANIDAVTSDQVHLSWHLPSEPAGAAAGGAEASGGGGGGGAPRSPPAPPYRGKVILQIEGPGIDVCTELAAGTETHHVSQLVPDTEYTATIVVAQQVSENGPPALPLPPQEGRGGGGGGGGGAAGPPLPSSLRFRTSSVPTPQLESLGEDFSVVALPVVFIPVSNPKPSAGDPCPSGARKKLSGLPRQEVLGRVYAPDHASRGKENQGGGHQQRQILEEAVPQGSPLVIPASPRGVPDGFKKIVSPSGGAGGVGFVNKTVGTAAGCEVSALCLQVRVSQTHTRTTRVDTMHIPLIDAEGSGPAVENVTVHVGCLRPNTAYLLQFRHELACSTFGAWSQELPISTLSPLVPSITSVGEQFAVLAWDREAGLNEYIKHMPQIYQVVVQETSLQPASGAEPRGAAAPPPPPPALSAGSASSTPLSVSPESSPAVTTPSSTQGGSLVEGSGEVVDASPGQTGTPSALQLRIMPRGAGGVGAVAMPSLALDVPATPDASCSATPGSDSVGSEVGGSGQLFHTCVQTTQSCAVITGLKPRTSYRAKARQRTSLRENEWGVWSDEVALTTLPDMIPSVVSRGQDYLQIAWARERKTARQTHPCLAICYDDVWQRQLSPLVGCTLRISDHGSGELVEESEVPCTEGDSESRVFTTSGALQPDTIYSVSVLMRYNPVCAGVVQEGMQSAWCHKACVPTLPMVCLRVAESRETSMMFSWGRPSLNTAALYQRLKYTEAQKLLERHDFDPTGPVLTYPEGGGNAGYHLAPPPQGGPDAAGHRRALLCGPPAVAAVGSPAPHSATPHPAGAAFSASGGAGAAAVRGVGAAGGLWSPEGAGGGGGGDPTGDCPAGYGYLPEPDPALIPPIECGGVVPEVDKWLVEVEAIAPPGGHQPPEAEVGSSAGALVVPGGGVDAGGDAEGVGGVVAVAGEGAVASPFFNSVGYLADGLPPDAQHDWVLHVEDSPEGGPRHILRATIAGCGAAFCDAVAVLLLMPDQVYSVRVKLVDGLGREGPWSHRVFATTLPIPEVTVGRVSETTAEISWVRPAPSCSDRLLQGWPPQHQQQQQQQAGFPHAGVDTSCQLIVVSPGTGGRAASPGGGGKGVGEQEEEEKANQAGSAEHCLVDTVISQADRQAFRVSGLIPGARYSVLVRFCNSKDGGATSHYGPWSAITRFATLTGVWEDLDVVDIGQDYCRISWSAPTLWRKQQTPPVGADGGEANRNPHGVGGAGASPRRAAPCSGWGESLPQGGTFVSAAELQRACGAYRGSTLQFALERAFVADPEAADVAGVCVRAVPELKCDQAGGAQQSASTGVAGAAGSGGDAGCPPNGADAPPAGSGLDKHPVPLQWGLSMSGGAPLPKGLKRVPGGASGTARWEYTLQGLTPHTVYQLGLKSEYAEDACTGVWGGGSGKPCLRFVTMQMFEFQVISIGETWGHFGVRVPPQPAEPGVSTPVRDTPCTFEILLNDLQMPQWLRMGIPPTTYSDLKLRKLRRDSMYSVRLRETRFGRPWGSWLPMATFSTQPHPPQVGELMECRDGWMSFNWCVFDPKKGAGVKLQGDDVPKEYMFSVDVRRVKPKDPVVSGKRRSVHDILTNSEEYFNKSKGGAGPSAHGGDVTNASFHALSPKSKGGTAGQRQHTLKSKQTQKHPGAGGNALAGGKPQGTTNLLSTIRSNYVPQGDQAKSSSSEPPFPGLVWEGDWEGVGITEKPFIRLPLQGDIAEFFFRVRLSKHFVGQKGKLIPTWGEYGMLFHWTKPSPPRPAQRLRVEDLTSTSALIAWDPPRNYPTQPRLLFDVFLDTAPRDSHPQWRLLHTTDTTTFAFDNLNPSQHYRVAVRAESAFGKALKSNVLSFTTHVIGAAPGHQRQHALKERLPHTHLRSPPLTASPGFRPSTAPTGAAAMSPVASPAAVGLRSATPGVLHPDAGVQGQGGGLGHGGGGFGATYPVPAVLRGGGGGAVFDPGSAQASHGKRRNIELRAARELKKRGQEVHGIPGVLPPARPNNLYDKYRVQKDRKQCVLENLGAKKYQMSERGKTIMQVVRKGMAFMADDSPDRASNPTGAARPLQGFSFLLAGAKKAAARNAGEVAQGAGGGDSGVAQVAAKFLPDMQSGERGGSGEQGK